MKEYCRVMSDYEKAEVLRSDRITLNREDWVIYPPQTVVFLFDLSQASDDFVQQCAAAHREARGETWILRFRAALETETDKSQTGWDGAVVCRQPISLTQAQGVTWHCFA